MGRLKTILFAPLLDIEAGAGFGGVFVVAVDRCYIVLLHQVLHQLEHGKTLERGAGVGRATVGIEAADIGDADAVGIVTFGVCAGLLHRAASADAAIGIDDVLIANVAPAKGAMVSPYGFHRADGVRACGSAMDDDFSDCSHDDFFFKRGRGWVLGAPSRWLEIRRR